MAKYVRQTSFQDSKPADGGDVRKELDNLAASTNSITAEQISAGAVTSSAILDGTIVNADISGSAAIALTKTNLTVSRQDITTNSTITAAMRVQYGWGYIQGNDTAQISQAVTFPADFGTTPIVVCQIEAGYRTSAPGALSDAVAANEAQLIVAGAHATAITSTGFTVYLNHVANNFTSARFYRYTWIALG